MPRRSFRLLPSLSLLPLAVVGVVGAACPIAAPPPPPGEADRRSFIANLTDEIVVPRLTDFATRATALRDATDLLGAAGAAGERDDAQQAWRAAMAVWQQLEVVHLGPAGSPASFVAGKGLRDRIHAWPQINLCAVDQQIFVNEFEDDGWAELRLPNVIGLAALEYALFVEGADNACPSTAGLNADGSWAALGADEIRARRARFAAVLADDVEAQAIGLRDAWTSTGGFAESLKAAGKTGSSFSTAQQALDEVYAALFFIELVTKDKKLGIPAGLHIDCPTASCPEKFESRFSQTSKEHVIANLAGVRAVFLGIDRDGVDDAGFDDLLRDRGADDLATAMTQSLDAALAATNGFTGSFEDALVTDPDRVQAIYAAVKVFTDDFKSTFPSSLGLRVPDEGAGDND